MPAMTLIAKGVYGVPLAARILAEEPRTVKRWAFGYTRRGTAQKPVIDTFLPTLDGTRALSFLELVELFTVREFRRVGCSWHRIRQTFEHNKEALGTPYPFAYRRWLADPAGIYYQDDDDSPLVEASGGGQVAMKHALDMYLQRLDFGLDNLAARWFPLGKHRPVVIDPEVAFGAPVVKGTGIETAVIRGMVEAGESIEAVAWWYDLEHQQVDAALEYERSLTAA